MVKMLVFDLKESEKEYFKTSDCTDLEITTFKEHLHEETKLTAKQYEETVVLSIFISSKITEKILKQFKNLRRISTRSNEYDHIDLEACRKRNIAVIHVNDYGREAVAQYVIGTIFSLTRKLPSAIKDIKSKQVIYEKYEGDDIKDLSIGVIGTGSTGAEVCKLANALNMKIYANDIKINNEIKDFTQYISFTDLLRKSDIITLHIPYIKEFHHMISYKEIEIMKDSAYIINCSNGELINTIALYDGIRSNKLRGVALDVTECNEWRNNTQEFNNRLKNASYECLENTIAVSELMEFDNVIITPRIAYNTKSTTKRILKLSIQNIKDYFKGRCTDRVV